MAVEISLGGLYLMPGRLRTASRAKRGNPQSYGEYIKFALEGEQHLIWAFDFRLGL